jgi:hypothetical protein
MPAYEGFSPDGYIAKTDEGFVEMIERAYKEDSIEKQNIRKKLAGENSWDGKVEKQIKIINSYFIRK